MLRPSRAVAVLLAIASTGLALVVAAAPAAADTPPWEPDPTSVGTLTFYDASGNAITSGRTDVAPFAAYVSGTAYPRSGDVFAATQFANPDTSGSPDNWYVEDTGLYAHQPLTSGPASIQTLSQTHPVVVGGNEDQTLDGFEHDSIISTTAGYRNVVQVRLRTANSAGNPSTKYDVADVSIDPTTHTWTQVYPAVNTVPGAPTAVRALAGDGSASLSWTAPASNGGSTITGYSVQYAPSGSTSWTDVPHSGTGTTQTVSGLTNGRSYTFRVAAINANGTGAYSQTAVTTPQANGTFVSLAPARLIDTRSPKKTLGTKQTLHLQVLGAGGVPSGGVSSVVLNVTATGAGANGVLTVYPDGATLPTASNLNFQAGVTRGNLVVVQVGSDGKVALYNNSSSTVDLVADVAGYYLGGTPTAAGAFRSLAPTRLLDTRSPKTTPGAKQTVHLQVLGRAGIPSSGVSSVVLNVTATNVKASGVITAYPDGTALPTASNLNLQPGVTAPNLTVVRVGSDGKVALYNGSSSTVDLVVDVAGYFIGGTATTPGAFVSLPPSRVLDTRIGNGGRTLAARSTLPVQILGKGGVASTGVSSVVMNLTATKQASSGYVTAYPTGTSLPVASSLNFQAGGTRPNLVTVRVGTGGKVSLYNGSAGNIDLVADVAGYYLAAS